MEGLIETLTPAQALQALNNAVKQLPLNWQEHLYLDKCVQTIAAALPKKETENGENTK